MTTTELNNAMQALGDHIDTEIAKVHDHQGHIRWGLDYLVWK